MARDDEFSFTRLDWRELSPQQWSELRRNAIRRAELLRQQSNREIMRKLTGSVLNGIVRVVYALSDALAWLKAAADERTAIARLQKLDDRALKDIGMDRSEIASVVRANGGDNTRIRRDTRRAA